MFTICSKSVKSHTPDDWVCCHSSHHPQHILYNTDTQQYIQEYIFISNSSNPQAQILAYGNRNRQDNELISVLDIEIMSGFRKVWVEYIPCRLGDIGEIELRIVLLILKKAGKGFKKLEEMGWRVKINEEMIGVNKIGDVKVWLSKDLHLNQPRPEETMLQESKSNQNNMVQQLIHLVKKHLYGVKDRQILDSIFINCFTFSELLTTIQQYVTLNKISLPDRLILSQLQVTASAQYFIDIIHQFQSPKSVVLIKHKPNHSQNFELSSNLRKSYDRNIEQNTNKVQDYLDKQKNSTEKHKRLSMMDIETEGLSQTYLKIPTTPVNGLNQRYGYGHSRVSPQKSEERKVENERYYTEISKGREEQLFDSRYKNVSSNIEREKGRQRERNNIHLGINDTKRVESEYKNILQFSRTNKFKKIRKDITNTVEILDMDYTCEQVDLSYNNKKNHLTANTTSNPNRSLKKFDEIKKNVKSQRQLLHDTKLIKIDSEHLQLNFNQKGRTPRCNSSQKPNAISNNIVIQRQAATERQYLYQFDRIQHRQLQGLKNNMVLNQIEAEFQQFLLTSDINQSPRSKSKRKIELEKEIPNLQFSKHKPPKKEISNQIKKYEYSNFYTNEVSLKASQIRAQTFRSKPNSNKIFSNSSTQNLFKMNPI